MLFLSRSMFKRATCREVGAFVLCVARQKHRCIQNMIAHKGLERAEFRRIFSTTSPLK